MEIPFSSDEPYTYASHLADLLSRLKHLNTPEYEPTTLDDNPDAAIQIVGAIRDALTEEVAIIEEDDCIVYRYPSATDDTDTLSRTAKHVSATIEYHANGRVWVETKYADTQDADHQRTFWTGWLTNYNEFEAYKMGALAAIHLLGQYTSAGLSPAEALDFSATTGIGYGDTFSWASKRDVGYEAVRKNAGNAAETLHEDGWDSRAIERDVHVARCEHCGENMQTADTCDPSRVGVLVDADGDTYERLPFGDEDQRTLEHLRESGADEEYTEEYKETIEKNPVEEGDRCHDCNVVTGGLHHEGCDKEICPQCGGQLLSCSCDWEFLQRLTD
jgi:hypothetical protein